MKVRSIFRDEEVGHHDTIVIVKLYNKLFTIARPNNFPYA